MTLSNLVPTADVGPAARHRARLRSIAVWVLALAIVATGFAATSPAANAAVPAPGATTSVITVKVGGDRVGQGTTDAGQTITTPLAGVQLGLYATVTSTSPVNTTWALCTSDAAGDCSFVVPNTQVGGANRDVRYFVRQISAPAGWYMNQTVRTGPASFAPSQLREYLFQTGLELRANTTYRSSSDFMFVSQSTSITSLPASSGVWQQSRNNPILSSSCGIDVALILDLSSSMTLTPGEPFTTASAITDAFVGSPTRMAVFTYGQVSPATAGANRPTLMPVSTPAGAAAFKAQWSSWSVNGGTNWDAGFYAAAAAAPHYDLAIHITDGQPSLFGSPLPTPNSSSWNRLKEIEYGIFSANLLKSEGTRILAVGSGSSLNDPGHLNLRATSGPTGFAGSNATAADYILATDFAAAVAAVRQVAQENCAGTVSVVKQIVPSTTTGEDITGAQAAPAGWEFGGTTSSAGIGGLPATHTTIDDGTGAVIFPLTFSGGTTSGPVTIAETQQAGYEIVTQGGRNAVCVDTITGSPIAVTNAGSAANPGFTLTASAPASISCTVYNREVPEIPAELTVEKEWVVDGQTFAHGSRPAGLDAQLQLTGPGSSGATDQAWGQTRTGYLLDDVSTLSETTTLSGDYEFCSVEAAVTEVNGVAVDIPLGTSGHDITLDQEQNTAQVTNTVTCTQILTLVKEVGFGSADPSAWTLSATAPAPALPGPSGSHSSSTPVTAAVTGGASYLLAESGGPDTYLGSGWTCERDDTGETVVVTDDALTMPRGLDVTCTIVNETATVTLLKHVIDPQPGFESDAWNLIATPDDLTGGTLDTETVVGAETDIAGASTVEVRPGHGYTLSETSTGDVVAYRQVALERFDGSTWIAVSSESIVAPAPGENAVYRFVNERIPPVVLPLTGLTGGASSDAFMIAGATVTALAAVGGLWLLRRRRYAH